MTNDSLETLELGASLGAGSSGEVFEVVGRESRRVIKRFNSLAIDRQFLERNFARMAATPDLHGTPAVLDHRFTVPPYAVLMERISGEPLSKVPAMKESGAWMVIRRLAEILGHAHKHGVYHGHLHPGNILLSGEKREPIVMDYGSGLVGEIHHVDLGDSAFFCAPEQLLSGGRPWGEGRIQKWDVYSFGLIAFWLINERQPRGLAYLKEHHRLVAHSGGRPVTIDAQAFVEELFRSPEIAWGSSFALGKEFRLCREIIDRCLALNPADRPVDLREVRNQFRALEYRFALEDAEERVLRERRKQKAKLFGARTIAACLGLSFLGATYYLVEYFRKTYFFRNKVTQLDQVVVTQRAHITHLDERWADTVTDLKQSREAADTFFHQMAGGDNAGGSGVAAIRKEDLEKSREYYLKTLADVRDSPEAELESARALHSLAHIERKMELADRAVGHFREAIGAFDSALERSGEAGDSFFDIQSRLADSHESLSTLVENPLGLEALDSLERAVHHFEECIRIKPQDERAVARLAGTAFKLGRVYDAHSLHDRAIIAYSKSAELAIKLRKNSPEETHLTDLIGKLQFQAAKSLRMAGRTDDAINSHIAAMETIETLRGVNGFTALQSIQMAESYLELGELFVEKEATAEDLDQLYNESLRLVTSLNADNPHDPEVAILLCRSLTRLGELERREGKWSSGYRMAIRGGEALRTALEANAGHVEGTLVLAEARLEILKFLESEHEAAVKIAIKGVETAEVAGKLLGGESDVVEPHLSRLRGRLSDIFRIYGEVCDGLGESALSKKCREYSAMQISFMTSDETRE